MTENTIDVAALLAKADGLVVGEKNAERFAASRFVLANPDAAVTDVLAALKGNSQAEAPSAWVPEMKKLILQVHGNRINPKPHPTAGQRYDGYSGELAKPERTQSAEFAGVDVPYEEPQLSTYSYPYPPYPHQVRDDGVLILPDEAPKMTDGGIEIPDVARERPLQGTVIALGPGKTFENGYLKKPDFGIGRKVLFGRYSGVELAQEWCGKKLTLLRLDEVRIVLAEGIQ